MPMTRRERLRRAYFGEDMDRPGVYVRNGFPGNDPSYDRLKAELEARTELKGTWHGAQFEHAHPVEVTTEPCSADFERRIETLHTPRGDLRATTLVSLKGQPGMREDYFINTRADAEKYLSLPIPTIGGDVSSFFAADAAQGDSGIVDIGLGFNAAGFVAELTGSENFAILSITDRDVLHELCRQQLQILLQRTKFLLAGKVGPYFSILGQELLVPPLHGPADFDDFNVRYDKPIIDLVHEAGGRVHVHCHGSIKKVFNGFLVMGADVLHPFEPPPMGDIEPGDAKALARGKLCLEGNIQIHRFYEASPAEIRDETHALVDAAFDDRRGLIVCPTASPYIRGKGEACFPQFKAMIDAVVGETES